MEQPIQNGQIVILTKANWTTKTLPGGYIIRDDDVKGSIDIQVAKLANKSFVSIDTFSVEAFPSVSETSMQSIHVPDYLGAVTGNRFCLIYQPEKDQRIFAVYEIDEVNKKIVAKGQCEIKKVSVADVLTTEVKKEDEKGKDKKDKKNKKEKEKKGKKDKKEKEKSKPEKQKRNDLLPTAIMAIKDKVFIGFPGSVGLVDLSHPEISLNVFHQWQEQTWGRGDNAHFLKTIDAFAFDSTVLNSELVAIDDVVWPKYAFTYDVSQVTPKNVGRFDLPSGSNERYTDAVKHGNKLILTAKSTTSGGYSNKIVVLEGTKAIWNITEYVSPGEGPDGARVFAGNVWSRHSSVGLLLGNIIVITAGKRGVIAIPIDQIKTAKQMMYGSEYDVPTPHGVKNLNIGVSSEKLVTVKDKSTAFVLSTNEDNKSVLSEVKWNEQTNDLQVSCSHALTGPYDQLFMEM